MMDRNSATSAAMADGDDAAAAPETEKTRKPTAGYARHRPAMASKLTQLLTRKMTDKELKELRQAAVKKFKEENGEDIGNLDLQYLAKDCLGRLLEDGILGDHARAGAPPKLTAWKRRRALKLLLRGNNMVGKEFVGYTSLAQALEECSELRKIWEEANISRRTLKRALASEYFDQTGKKLRKISIIFKPKLSKKVKAQRLAKALEWLSWDPEKFRNTVWLDEKQEYLKRGGTLRCYAPIDMKSFIREAKKPLGKCPRLKYLAAVAAFCGPIYFRAITGTTMLKRGYLVRTVPPRADLNPARLCSRGPCRIEHIHLVTAVSVCNPHDVVAFCRCPQTHLLVPLPLLDVKLIFADEMVQAIPVDQEPCLSRVLTCSCLSLIQNNVHACFVLVCASERADLVNKLTCPATDTALDNVAEQAFFTVGQSTRHPRVQITRHRSQLLNSVTGMAT